MSLWSLHQEQTAPLAGKGGAEEMEALQTCGGWGLWASQGNNNSHFSSFSPGCLEGLRKFIKIYTKPDSKNKAMHPPAQQSRSWGEKINGPLPLSPTLQTISSDTRSKEVRGYGKAKDGPREEMREKTKMGVSLGICSGCGQRRVSIDSTFLHLPYLTPHPLFLASLLVLSLYFTEEKISIWELSFIFVDQACQIFETCIWILWLSSYQAHQGSGHLSFWKLMARILVSQHHQFLPLPVIITPTHKMLLGSLFENSDWKFSLSFRSPSAPQPGHLKMETLLPLM